MGIFFLTIIISFTCLMYLFQTGEGLKCNSCHDASLVEVTDPCDSDEKTKEVTCKRKSRHGIPECLKVSYKRESGTQHYLGCSESIYDDSPCDAFDEHLTNLTDVTLFTCKRCNTNFCNNSLNLLPQNYFILISIAPVILYYRK